MKKYTIVTPTADLAALLNNTVQPYRVQEMPFMSSAEKAALRNLYESITAVQQSVAVTTTTPVGSKIKIEKYDGGGHITERILFKDPSNRLFEWVKKQNSRGIKTTPFHHVVDEHITPLYML